MTDKDKIQELESRLEAASEIMFSMSFYLSEAIENRKHSNWMSQKNCVDFSRDPVIVRIYELMDRHKEFVKSLPKKKKQRNKNKDA